MKQTLFFEKTIATEVTFTGRALFTGEDVEITLLPAEAHEGIVFKKIIANDKEITIPVDASSIYNASNRNTVLSDKTPDGTIHCVEHLLSALFGCGITNVVIKIKGSEVPIFDGSAKPFVEKILEAGVVNQHVERESIKLTQPQYWSEGNVHIIALPSDELRFSYTLSYDGHPRLNSQFYTLPYSDDFQKVYERDIAPARTFCLYEEAKALLESGAIKGGSLDCAVVLKGEEVLNPEGLRFNDEMVRHKVLDMIGDLSLMAKCVVAHFIGIRSGHEANAILVKKIVEGLEKSEEEKVQGAYV